MAAAARKLESLSLVMDVNNLEDEEELSTMVTLAWAEFQWLGRWKASWRQVTGPPAVMCETRDLGMAAVARLAVWGTGGGGHVSGLLAGRERDASDTSHDWKKRTTKQECAELKKGVWPEPIQGKRRGRISTEMSRGNWSWKADVCSKDCTTLIGLTKRSVEDVTKKKALRITDCFTAQVPEDLRNGNKGVKLQRKIGSGKEESRRAFCMKPTDSGEV